MTVLHVIRPEPGCGATLAAARAMGLDAHGTPLFEVTLREWSLPEGPFDAIVAGSANAFRHGGTNLAQLRHVPVLAVGESTALAARAAGFSVASTGSGGLQELLDQLEPAHRRMLRLAGAERIELDPPTGAEMVERVVYASKPLPMQTSLAETLRGGGIVLLHSAAAAGHFAAECDRLSLDRGAIALATIGPRVAAAAGEGWRALACADEPNDAALLALARSMCQ
jgi:uroporphyrinogen-III synthase